LTVVQGNTFLHFLLQYGHSFFAFNVIATQGDLKIMVKFIPECQEVPLMPLGLFKG